MRSEPFNHDSLVLKTDSCNHAVPVSFDIENDTTVGYEISTSEISFYGIEVLPFCFSDSFEPGCQIRFRIRMNFVKFFQFSETDHIHEMVCIVSNKNRAEKLAR
jgi:hypothetical protein